MALGVTVLGVQRDGGGIKRALAENAKHNKAVADALLNVSGINTIVRDETGKIIERGSNKAVHEDEEREAYNPNDDRNQWPKMMYHSDGREVLVFNFVETKDAASKGYREQPYLKAQVAVMDPAEEKKRLLDRLNHMEAEKNQATDLAIRAMQRLEDLEGRFADMTRPKVKEK